MQDIPCNALGVRSSGWRALRWARALCTPSKKKRAPKKKKKKKKKTLPGRHPHPRSPPPTFLPLSLSLQEEKVSHALHNFEGAVKSADIKLSVAGGDAGKGAKAQKTEVTIYTLRHGVVR